MKDRDRLPLRAVVRSPGYMGWWWHVEDANGDVLSFIGHAEADITRPDGVVLRGRARTQRGARRRAEAAMRQAEQHFPPEGGWRPNRHVKENGAAWLPAESDP